MKEINGIRILEEGDDHASYLPEGLCLPIFEGLHAPYGFKTEVHNGKMTWVPATKEDYLKAEAQKLGVDITSVYILVVDDAEFTMHSFVVLIFKPPHREHIGIALSVKRDAGHSPCEQQMLHACSCAAHGPNCSP